MSIREWILSELQKHGMWPRDSEAVFELIKSDESNEAMKDRWNDAIDGYPLQLKAICWLSAKRVALQWIDANKPKAFYRTLFAS